MTNFEKFREVFNIPNKITPQSPFICDFLDCENIRCSDCPLIDKVNHKSVRWDDEYKVESQEILNEELSMKRRNKELLMLRGARYAVSQMIDKGSCKFARRLNDGTCKTVYWLDICNYLTEMINDYYSEGEVESEDK